MVLAATSRGRLGLIRVLPPRVHAALDLVLTALLASGPLLPATRPDLTGIVAAEIVALLWLRIVTLTAYRPGPELADPGQADPGRTTTGGGLLARRLGRVAGRGAGKVAESLPEAERKLHRGANQLGRAAGRARRSGRAGTPPG